MFCRQIVLISAACLLASVGLTNCQRFSDNSLSEQDFDYQDQGAQIPTRQQQSRPQSSFHSRTSFSSAAQPSSTRAPPVPILKQVNRHNEDGSYTYGFEGADGSFKIETKLPNGEVKGKYGYVDDSGKVRVVEYGANKYGFQPAGEGITVAPPTLIDETKLKKNKKVAPSQFSNQSPISVSEEVAEYDDGQYYEEPQIPVRTAQRLPVVSQQPKSRPAPKPQQATFQFQSAQPQQDFSQFQEQQISYPGQSIDRSSGPTPPRAQIAGAASVPSAAVPQRIAVPGATPVSSSRSSQPRPAPQFLYQPAPQARQAPRPTARQYTSDAFDELEKQFALPSNGAPATHDITFGAF